MVQDALSSWMSIGRVTLRLRAVVCVLGLVLCGTIHGRAAMEAKVDVMPAVASVQQGQGHLVLSPNMGVTYARFHDGRLEAGIGRMLRRLEYVSGLPQASKGSGVVVVDVAGAGSAVQSVDEDESYSLVVSPSEVKT